MKRCRHCDIWVSENNVERVCKGCEVKPQSNHFLRKKGFNAGVLKQMEDSDKRKFDVWRNMEFGKEYTTEELSNFSSVSIRSTRRYIKNLRELGYIKTRIIPNVKGLPRRHEKLRK